MCGLCLSHTHEYPPHVGRHQLGLTVFVGCLKGDTTGKRWILGRKHDELTEALPKLIPMATKSFDLGIWVIFSDDMEK